MRSDRTCTRISLLAALLGAACSSDAERGAASDAGSGARGGGGGAKTMAAGDGGPSSSHGTTSSGATGMATRDAGATKGAAGTQGGPAAGGDQGGLGDACEGAAAPARQVAASWCDPATWKGSVPDASTAAVPSTDVVIDCDAEAKTLVIPSGVSVYASREKSSTLTLHGNLVVRGRLDYGTPCDRIPRAVTAEIVFTGMNDQDYEGTPTPEGDLPGPGDFRPPLVVPLEILESDVGLWIVDDGVFTAAGQLKKAWSKLTTGAGPGDKTLSVEDASGWQSGDRLVLTPTALSSVPDHFTQFDEVELATVSAKELSLRSAPAYEHAGCDDCLRRGEAANLSRNVIVRSADETAHAHMIAGNHGLIQLDSVELRWLGPQRECSGGAPQRRAPIWFHQQGDGSIGSYVRHVSIWGARNHFMMQEASNGVEVTDVAGYDTIGTGFSQFYDSSSCDTRCVGGDAIPQGTRFVQVLSAKVAVPVRVEGCNAIGSVMAIMPSGGEGSGCVGCVATGTAYNYGSPYGNIGAIHSAEGGAGRPEDFVLNDNVAHNNAAHGIANWQNTDVSQPAYENNQAWSNTGDGVHHGAYDNSFGYRNLISQDNGGGDFAVIATEVVPDHVRLDGAVLDQFKVMGYFAVPETPVVVHAVSFTGAKEPAITQVHDACSGGDETDPADGTCIRNWLRFIAPEIPAGVKPFEFGWTSNKNAKWEIRGFTHPDYPDLPENFDLYRKDNEVSGGSYNADFDAWLVPQ